MIRYKLVFHMFFVLEMILQRKVKEAVGIWMSYLVFEKAIRIRIL